MKISLQSVRRMALYVQGLDGQWSLPSGKEGAVELIERLGYVQVDTIARLGGRHL